MYSRVCQLQVIVCSNVHAYISNGHIQVAISVDESLADNVPTAKIAAIIKQNSLFDNSGNLSYTEWSSKKCTKFNALPFCNR